MADSICTIQTDFISEIDQLIAYKSSDHEFRKSALELFPSQLYALSLLYYRVVFHPIPDLDKEILSPTFILSLVTFNAL